MQWDVFCRVIDNHGDVGVCWRLAADLAARGEAVRLWLDDASALRWMAPAGACGVEVLPWPADDVRDSAALPGDVVVEAFGCTLPAGFVARMAQASRPPVWINLDYLSAEAFVERIHGLPSPQATGPGAGLRKWFFCPGFTPCTGGLIREPPLMQRQSTFERKAWLQAHGVQPAPGERVVSLFCYEQPALPALIDALACRPTVLLATFGHAARQVRALLGPGLRRGALRAVLLPALTQPAYDELLWASELNFVRGEDSFVRAQWAGKPFVWQAYAQHDGVHIAKVDAFLQRFMAPVPRPADALLSEAPLRGLWHIWNSAGDPRAAPLVAEPLNHDSGLRSWHDRCRMWRDALLNQSDLTCRLLGFVAASR